MKTQLLNTALVMAVSTALVACGDNSSSDSTVTGLAKPQPAAPETEKEFTGEPASAEEMAAQTYRLKTESQEFVLKKLAHLVWARFDCKAEVPDGNTNKNVDMTVSFYPALEINLKAADLENKIVSPASVCGRKLENPVGSLVKNDNNQYVLQYGVKENQVPVVSMSWDAGQATPGELLCTAEDGVITKAIINECTLVPVVQDKP